MVPRSVTKYFPLRLPRTDNIGGCRCIDIPKVHELQKIIPGLQNFHNNNFECRIKVNLIRWKFNNFNVEQNVQMSNHMIENIKVHYVRFGMVEKFTCTCSHSGLLEDKQTTLSICSNFFLHKQFAKQIQFCQQEERNFFADLTIIKWKYSYFVRVTRTTTS